MSTLATLYRSSTIRARLHVAVRELLFPFRLLDPYLPEGGTVLDLGCGHGMWSLHVALSRPDLQVLGVDPDEDKIRLASELAAANGIASVRFSVGTAQSAILPEADAVGLIDVLYLIPYAEQEELLERAASALRPGGTLLLKTMSDRPRWKARWNLLQETLSVRVLNITVGGAFYFRSPGEWRALLEGLGLGVTQVPLDRGRLHPHLLMRGLKA